MTTEFTGPASRPRRGRATLAAAIAALLGVLALAGCSAGATDESTAGEQDRGGAGLGAPPGEAPAGAPDAPNAPVDERALIYTGTITVQVPSVVEAADEAISIATVAGGIVAGDNRSIDDDGSHATLVLRVPTDRFTSTLDSLAALGTERSREVQAEDVTETLIDLDARIASQQASVDRVRALLARAETIGEIVSVEAELTRRQADLDSLVQRRAGMAGLVALATITLQLRGPGAAVEEEETETGFLAGLRAGWKGFLASVEIVLTVAGALLPFLIAIGGPVLALVWVLRRRRRARQVAPPPPGP